jgi:hypothetical protein
LGASSSSLLNQSENSDRAAKSFNNWSWMARAVRSQCRGSQRGIANKANLPPRIALEFGVPWRGFPDNARSPHQVNSCFMRLGSVKPSASICL